MQIFNNEISKKDYKKACKSKKKFIRKFTDDSDKNYHLALEENSVITKPFGVMQIVIDGENELHEKNEKKENEGCEENSLKKTGLQSFNSILAENPVIIGNIRMGFGHYRISMAMASAAKSLGYTPLWLDLNSFPQTTGTKIISSQNELYSLGSRLSQKFSLFNKLVWEPLNYEGFKKLSYNACDQKNSDLMTSIFREIPKDIPFVGTHVWPSQAAVHAGMTKVVNAIPDNWPMALHLAEGSLHTVQTFNAFYGYKTLHGFDKNKVLNPIPDDQIVYTGHYIDHEIVSNIEKDCENRISRCKNGKSLRILLTIGGAGAQGDFFSVIIKKLIPYVKNDRACIYINCGDYENVWNKLKNEIPELNDDSFCHTHFNNWDEETAFALAAQNENSDSANSTNSTKEKNDLQCSKGIHAFCNKDIFAAVYITNLLMRGTDLLITKPSELSFYPVPKLFIRRVGGHEMWGAIHSAEIGDGTPECESPEYACSVLEMMINNPELIVEMCNNIMKNKSLGIYDGAYRIMKLIGEMKN